jgi:hypothetical protein
MSIIKKKQGKIISAGLSRALHTKETLSHMLYQN